TLCVARSMARRRNSELGAAGMRCLIPVAAMFVDTRTSSVWHIGGAEMILRDSKRVLLTQFTTHTRERSHKSLCIQARLCFSNKNPPMRKRLENYFEFAHLGTNWRTEILAGVTTFLTMAYIVLVNPAILADAGVPLPAVTAATCLSAAFGSILMGILARYPIALAPGMGLNAYFTYTVCIKMHVPWQTALGAVFLSGVIFLALTAAGIRQMILHAIPHQLYAAVASGIGLFIAFIGFQHAGLIVRDPNTLVGMGNIRNPTTYLALFGHPDGCARSEEGARIHLDRRAERDRRCLGHGPDALDAFDKRISLAYRHRLQAQRWRGDQQRAARDYLCLLLR